MTFEPTMLPEDFAQARMPEPEAKEGRMFRDPTMGLPFRKVSFDMLGYEEARRQDSRADIWMLLAENAALSARGFICEDGTELPKEEGQEAAQEEREALEKMYAPDANR
jgi:hypothetical protein